MTTTSGTALAALLVSLLIGCGEDPEGPASPRGLRSTPAAQEAAQKSPAIRRSSGRVGRDPHSSPATHINLETPPPAAPIVVTERQERPGEDLIRARDYAAELRGLLGDPSRCLSAEDRALGRHIAFQVEVDVMSSGRVLDARATSPGVSAAALRCVTTAARGVRFEPFTDGTRSVQASLALQLRAPD